MLVLLPPSEGKTAPSGGPAVDVSALVLPTLAKPRDRVIDALVRVSGGSTRTATKTLGISERQADELEFNRLLRSAPSAPSIEVYTGVLYDALAAASLPKPARRWLDEHVLIASALFGVTRPNDLIPTYRLSGDVTLPRLGPLAAYWRKHLSGPLDEYAERIVIVDLRSQVYANAWQPSADQLERTAAVRVLQRALVNGEPRLRVVSHNNKFTKGLLVRELAQNKAKAATVPQLHDVVRDLGYETALEQRKNGEWQLDVITSG